MKKPCWEIFQTKNKQYAFHLIAPNGKIICQSESYTRKANAYKGVLAIRKYAGSKVSE